MQGYFSKPSPPSDDRRWKLVDGTMRRHGHEPSALIEVLHTVQESFGFISEEALLYVAKCLHVPFSKAYGVATFYHFFSLKPAGEHTCVVCTGTACYIKGAPALLKAIEETAGIRPGETTPDGKLSLVTARCLGSCGLAPLTVYDSEIHGKVTAENVREHVRRFMEPAVAAPAVAEKGVGA